MNAVVFPWTADSDVVTADSDLYTASGYGPSSPQFPDVPALPGVPNLARMATPAAVSAQATTSGLNQALSAQLGLSTTVNFGVGADFAGLGLQSL